MTLLKYIDFYAKNQKIKQVRKNIKEGKYQELKVQSTEDYLANSGTITQCPDIHSNWYEIERIIADE